MGKGRQRHTVTRTVTKTVLRKAPPPQPDATCNADFVSGARGMREGVDAASRTAREGFPRGTTVFLDIERMDVHATRRCATTTRPGCARCSTTGAIVPGIYVHTYNANTVYDDVKSVYRSVGSSRASRRSGSRSRPASTSTKLPSEMGHTFAAVWQGVLDVEQTWNGHKIPIDVNVAALALRRRSEIAARFGRGSSVNDSTRSE